ncbi:MAG: hypothetical protein E6G97_18240 [Alphaproteobacteria bacterium]|nr:MAG: hypothetical protein E6G97_18240 [Alphaproteobacteria bacterium]
MTLRQWLDGQALWSMFTTAEISERKQRLLVCVLAQKALRKYKANASRKAIETSLRYADGLADSAELYRAFVEARSLCNSTSLPLSSCKLLAMRIAGCCASLSLTHFFSDNWLPAQGDVGWEALRCAMREVVEAPFALRRLCIFKPSRRRADRFLASLVERNETTQTAEKRKKGVASSTLVEERWKKVDWLSRAALDIARLIYEEDRFEDLPILADALEDAGCTEEHLLMHLRGKSQCPACLESRQALAAIEQVAAQARSKGVRTSGAGQVSCSECNQGWRPLQGPHFKGCWALDLILGKE